MLSPYSTNPRQEIIKASKVYFEDLGIVNLLNDSFQNFSHHSQKGSLAEGFLLTEFLKGGINPFFHLHFWRTKQGAEVDFVVQPKEGKMIPVEVKYQPFSAPKIPSGLRAFIRKYHPSLALVATLDFFGQSQIGKTKILFIPVWLCS